MLKKYYLGGFFWALILVKRYQNMSGLASADCSKITKVLLEFFLSSRIKWSTSNQAVIAKTCYLTANQRKAEKEKEKMKFTWIHRSRNYLTNHFILQAQVTFVSQIFDDYVYIVFGLDIALEVKALHGIIPHCHGLLPMHRSCSVF